MRPITLNREYIKSTTTPLRYRIAILTYKLFPIRRPRYVSLGGSEQSRRTMYMVAGL